MVQYGRPSRSSWTESVRSSFGRTVMGQAIWEDPIETWLGATSKLGMSLCTWWKRIFLSVYVDDIKLAGKKTKTLIRCGNYSTKKSIWENQHLFSGSCILGMHSTTMWNKQRYCGQLQNHVRIENYRGRSREITNPSKSSHFFMVLWYGGSCKEVCGTILWVGKQDDSTTLQSIYSMHRWPPLQRRRNEICRRIVTCMLSNCSIMLKLGTNWTTWYFMVSKQARTIHHNMDQSLWQTPESIDFK